MTVLALLFWALAAPAGAVEGPSYAVGTSFAAGSGGYWRFGLSGDGQWPAPPWLHYAWTEFGLNPYANRLSLGGGTWRDAGPDLRVKGGLSFSVGRYRDADASARSVTFETGVERMLESGAAGAEYLLTTGSLGARRVTTVGEVNRGGQLKRARTAVVEAPTFTDHTLAAYGRVPLRDSTLGLRVALDVLSDSEDVLSETLSWRLPAAEDVWLTPALTLEQSRTPAVIASLALSRVFD